MVVYCMLLHHIIFFCRKFVPQISVKFALLFRRPSKSVLEVPLDRLPDTATSWSTHQLHLSHWSPKNHPKCSSGSNTSGLKWVNGSNKGKQIKSIRQRLGFCWDSSEVTKLPAPKLAQRYRVENLYDGPMERKCFKISCGCGLYWFSSVHYVIMYINVYLKYV